MKRNKSLLKETTIPPTWKNDIKSLSSIKPDPIPDTLAGFEYKNKEEAEKMIKLYPEGEEYANTKLLKYAEKSMDMYKDTRDFAWKEDGTSGLSPYLSIGTLYSSYAMNRSIVSSTVCQCSSRSKSGKIRYWQRGNRHLDPRTDLARVLQGNCPCIFSIPQIITSNRLVSS